jgi:hypothetical protein
MKVVKDLENFCDLLRVQYWFTEIKIVVELSGAKDAEAGENAKDNS